MGEVGGSNPSGRTIFTPGSFKTDLYRGILRMFCNECSVEPASVDHLDLSQGEARFRSLCGPCSEAEFKRWNRERVEGPLGHPYADKDRRAA